MNYLGMQYGIGPSLPPVFGIGLIVIILWSLLWKGLALWRAAKRGDKIWFVVFMIVNTVGILEIIYFFFIAGAKWPDFTSSGDDRSHNSH